jgi:hypothetical protein
MTATQLYVGIGILSGAAALLLLCLRGIRALFRLATAATRLVEAIGSNTTATERLSDRLTLYQTETNARLDALEHRRFL